MRRLRRCLVATLAGGLFVGVASATAQTVGATTGALNGRVTDQAEALLPGVTVVLSGPAMMGVKMAATDTRGSYEIAAVPPGEYSLSFSLTGFASKVRYGIRVNLGETATVDERLDLAWQETSVVSARSPVIDRSGTAIAHVLEARQLADLPASRSSTAIFDATPGLQLARFDVGGSAGPSGGATSAYGTTGPNRPTIEGIAITGYNQYGFTLDYGSFAHVSVGLGAYGPDWPWPGAAIRFVTKAGSNQHRGSLYLDYMHRAMQAFNIDRDQIALGVQGGGGLRPREVNRQWSYHDANVDAGGPIRTDRLWWYVSFRDQDMAARHVNYAVGPRQTHLTNVGGKITALTARSSRLVVFGQAAGNHQPTRQDGFLRPATAINRQEDSTSNQLAQGGVWKAEWNAFFRQRLYVEVLGGQFLAGRHERPNGTSPPMPRVEDDSNLTVDGRSRDWIDRNRDDQIIASASFMTTSLAGTHHVKLGGELRRNRREEEWLESYPNGVLHITSRGLPTEVILFEAPSKSVVGQLWYAASLNDSWQMARRLTLNLGVRFDRYRMFLPAQTHEPGESGDRSWPGEGFSANNNVANWNAISPRLGLNHTLTDDGRTVVKLTYGKYWLPPGPDVLFSANKNSKAWYWRFKWEDDGNKLWDPGEEIKEPGRSGGAAVESLDPDIALEFVQEVTARIEREIAPNTSFETGVIWRDERLRPFRQDATVPFSAFTQAMTVIDPGVDGDPGNDDDGRSIVVYDLPEPRPAASYVVRNVPGGRSDYITWEVNARRRMHGRWSLVAGFSHTWTREHANTYFGQTVRANVFPLSPNDLINTQDGRHEFLVWSARAYGTYDGPWGLRITPYLRHQSGQPYGRTFSRRLNNLQASINILAEPIGTRRMDHITLFDLRVGKTFSLGAARDLSVFVDGFNLLNANPAQSINFGSGVFQRPLVIVPPRIARIGAKFEW